MNINRFFDIAKGKLSEYNESKRNYPYIAYSALDQIVIIGYIGFFLQKRSNFNGNIFQTRALTN